MKLRYLILFLFGILVSCSSDSDLISIEKMSKGVHDDKIASPKCINDICLYQHIDEISDKISGFVGKDIWSPAQALESEDYDVMESTYWVDLTLCESPGTVKTVLRVIKNNTEEEFNNLLNTYEEKFGPSIRPIVDSSRYERASWKWKNPDVDLGLALFKELRIVSIELHEKDLFNKDFRCSQQSNSQPKQ